MPRASRAALPGLFVDFLKFLAVAALLAMAYPVFAGERILAARVWPAQEYTRVTLESEHGLHANHFMLDDPPRLVVDLEGVGVDSQLNGLAAKVGNDDPYIKSVRVALNRPNVVRVVFDLRTEVKPSIFTLPPAGEYRHRLVLDLYPAKPVDPLLALVTPQADPIREIGQATPSLGVSKALEAKDGARKADAAARASDSAAPKDASPKVVATASVASKADGAGAGKASSDKSEPQIERLVIVAIDAGHGGEDPGAHGRHGTREKNVTLAIARRLKVRIDREPNMRAVLIRDGDYFIPLAQRVAKARRLHADLFVSIHADAWVRPDARGSSVFALSERGATSAAARLLAKRENESDMIGGVDLGAKDPVLARTLLDLSLTATINDSLKLGKAVLSELGDVNELHKERVEQAGFAVLKAPDIPSILVETAFISNPEEEKRLKDAAYQDRIAGAVFSGLKRYLAQNPPLARPRLAAN